MKHVDTCGQAFAFPFHTQVRYSGHLRTGVHFPFLQLSRRRKIFGHSSQERCNRVGGGGVGSRAGGWEGACERERERERENSKSKSNSLLYQTPGGCVQGEGGGGGSSKQFNSRSDISFGKCLSKVYTGVREQQSKGRS